MTKRRGSRLFSGQPGLLLVSEDIPGITMPAPPPDMAPLEDDEPEFDLSQLHAAEDQEEEDRGSDGPLRVFLGATSDDSPQVNEDEPPIFDVSALAMPEGPDAVGSEDDALDFLDDSIEVDEDAIVNLDDAPPPLAMGVSDDVLVDDVSVWEDSPTIPAMPTSSLDTEVRTAVISDTPPAAQVAPEVAGDPSELPESDPFMMPENDLGILGTESDFSEDGPTRVEEGAPGQVAWDEDDMGFFDDAPTQVRVPATPPNLKVDTGGESRSFRPIPEKEDPPIWPLMVILALMVVMSILFWFTSADEPDPEPVAQPVPVVAPPIRPNNSPAPRTEGPGQVGEVTGSMGYLSIDSDKPANIYVDDRKVGVTPVVKAEVNPGGHRVLAVEVETGKRKALTASVQRGEERRVHFAFQPVQR